MENDMLAKQKGIAKLRVAINKAKEELGNAVAGADFTKAREVQATLDELEKQVVVTEEELRVLQEERKGTSEERDVLAGKEETKGNTGLTLGERSTSNEEKKNALKASGMKGDDVGGTLEERGVLALERVADSMEALVRTTLIVMMMKMGSIRWSCL